MPMALITVGSLRIPVGLNSEGSIGRSSEGNSFPDCSQTSTMVATDSEMRLESAFRLLDILMPKCLVDNDSQ